MYSEYPLKCEIKKCIFSVISQQLRPHPHTQIYMHTQIRTPSFHVNSNNSTLAFHHQFTFAVCAVRRYCAACTQEDNKAYKALLT